MVDPAKPGLVVDSVHFRIGEFEINEISLTVNQGEYFVLTGPNGSGKTLLIKLIAGLCQPEQGSIRLGGEPITDLPPWERGIGYVAQDGLLFPNRTVRRNIAFGLEVRRVDRTSRDQEVERAAEMLGIAHLLDRVPAGLSGGEQQKASLARALVLKPRLLLLDEPLSAIDEEARDAVCEELRNLQRETGVTTIHVSHNRRETALLADRVGCLRGGGLERIAEPAEFA